MGDANWNPATGNLGAQGGTPSVSRGGAIGNDRSALPAKGGPREPSMIAPQERSGVDGDTGSSSPSPEAAPAPSSRPFPIQAPPFPFLLVQVPPRNPFFGKNCTQYLGPVGARGDYGHLTSDELFNPPRRCGCAREVSKAALKSRVAGTDAFQRKRNRGMADAIDTPGSIPAS